MSCSSEENVVNHGVLIVGWGIDDFNQEYFVVKNNFGEQWGQQGFARIASKASPDVPFGTCNILYSVMAPELSNYFDIDTL